MSASFSKGGAGKVNVHFNAWIKINISTHKIWSIFDPCLHYLVSRTLITPKYLELLKIWSQPIPERKLISADYALKKTDCWRRQDRQEQLSAFNRPDCESLTMCFVKMLQIAHSCSLWMSHSWFNMKELPIKSCPLNNIQILIKQTH